MLSDERVPGKWECKLCGKWGYGGFSGYERHYSAKHIDRVTYRDFLIEARVEHKLTGAAAYEWAHSAWVEYERNQA